jgi:RNA polymerase sigma-70 factor (ECF subfamily)
MHCDITIGMPVDIAQLETHRSALMGHCYRMLGSAFDAEDAVQETMVRAWRSLDRFQERASLRTWLYRIATNVCLDALSDRSRRARPMEEGPVSSADDPLEARPRTHWLEPIPDARALPTDANPFELTVLRQSIRLAFVAALQHLPPRQRAALLLTEVLGWSAAEVADCLDMSIAAVNSALQRARATLASRNVTLSDEPLSDTESTLLDRYVDAFQRYDVETLVSLLREDATLSMPPYTLWLQGHAAIRTWLIGRGSGCRGSRLVPTNACGSPAFAQYRPSGPEGAASTALETGPSTPPAPRASLRTGYQAWALLMIEHSGDRIVSWNTFLDTETLFPLFGLPLRLPA